MSRFARRTDDNHARVAKALRRAGALVHSIASAGGGVPDLLVSIRGDLHLVEVKDGEKSPSERALTPAQEKWHANWAGPRVHVVTSPEEALTAVGLRIGPSGGGPDCDDVSCGHWRCGR